MNDADYFQYLESKDKLENIIFKKEKKKVSFSDIDVIRGAQRYTLYILKVLLQNGRSSVNDMVKYYTDNSNFKIEKSALRTNFYRYTIGDNKITGLEKIGFIKETGKKSQNKKQSMTYQLTPNGVLYCWHIFSHNTHDMGFAPPDNIKLNSVKERLDYVDPILEISAKHYSECYPLILKNFDSVKKSCGSSLDNLILFSDATWYSMTRISTLIDNWHYRVLISGIEDKKIHNDITFFFFVNILRTEIPNKKLLFQDVEIQGYCEKYIIPYYSYIEELVQGFKKSYFDIIKKK